MPEEKTTGIDRDLGRETAPLPVYNEERLYMEDEIQTLYRVAIFFVGVSAGLILALHLILRDRA